MAANRAVRLTWTDVIRAVQRAARRAFAPYARPQKNARGTLLRWRLANAGLAPRAPARRLVQSRILFQLLGLLFARAKVHAFHSAYNIGPRTGICAGQAVVDIFAVPRIAELRETTDADDNTSLWLWRHDLEQLCGSVYPLDQRKVSLRLQNEVRRLDF